MMREPPKKLQKDEEEKKRNFSFLVFWFFPSLSILDYSLEGNQCLPSWALQLSNPFPQDTFFSSCFALPSDPKSGPLRKGRAMDRRTTAPSWLPWGLCSQISSVLQASEIQGGVLAVGMGWGGAILKARSKENQLKSTGCQWNVWVIERIVVHPTRPSSGRFLCSNTEYLNQDWGYLSVLHWWENGFLESLTNLLSLKIAHTSILWIPDPGVSDQTKLSNTVARACLDTGFWAHQTYQAYYRDLGWVCG